MTRQASSLKRGDIETHINSMVGLHFNFVKENLEIDNNLFNALKILCVADNVSEAVEQAKTDLLEAEFDDYNLISSIMLNPKDTFRVLPLSTRFLALPTRQCLPPDYKLAAIHAIKVSYGLFCVVTSIIIIYQITDAMKLVQSTETNNTFEKSIYVGVLIFLVGYAVFRLLPRINFGMTLTRNSFFNLQDAVREKVLPRTIFAKPPSEQMTWEEALRGEIAERKSQFKSH